MKVFISYDMSQQAAFDNVADALKAAGIAYWDPQEPSRTLKLDDRVRVAISECQLCVLVATASSLKSYWCTAETAAFWGASAPVLVYGAEATLDLTLLPPHLSGQYVEYRISKLVESVRAHANTRQAPQISARPLSVAEIIASLKNKLGRATVELKRARDALAEYEQRNPGGSHTGIEGFEMAYSNHVCSLRAAIEQLESTQSSLWSIR